MKDKSPLLFSISSFAFILLIIWFVSISDTNLDWKSNIDGINEGWDTFNSLSTIWRLETLVVCGIAWAAFNLSPKSKWWNLVAVGHILMLSEYIFMLGGYKHIASEETYLIINEMANWTFITSNLIWIVGMLGVYLTETRILKLAGVGLAFIAAILIGAVFFGIASLQTVGNLAMPLVLLLYALNTVYGIIIYKREASATPS